MRLGQNEAKYKRKCNDEPKSSLPFQYLDMNFQYLDIYFQYLDEKGQKEPKSNEIRQKRSKI
jgi:hypothetical protein